MPSTLEAVKKIAKAYREKFNIPIVGISGSVGKTSTKEMLYSVLSQKFKAYKTQGNLNNELGVPLTILNMPEDTEVAIIEIGISNFGEMNSLSEIVQPTICVLTVIGDCHLENLKDRDGVLTAKTEMFKHARDGASFVLNGDDDKLSAISSVKGTQPVFFGLNNKNHYYAENIKNNFNNIRCTLCFGQKTLDINIHAIGNHMVSNALAAVAVGTILGLNDEQLKTGIEAYRTIAGRANVINTESLCIIDDCYNANPTSVKASIDSLASLPGRKIAILGDMKGLGEKELELHYNVGFYAKDCGISRVLSVGPLAKEIARVAKDLWFDSVESLVKELPNILQEGDTVLVKASRAMCFEIVIEYLIDFAKKS